MKYVYFTFDHYPILPNCSLTEVHAQEHWLHERERNKIYMLVYSSKSASMIPIDVNKNIFNLYY